MEQLDLHTEEVLRRYRTGTEAATLMKVFQAQISNCCTGKATSAYGFKWRKYVGPPIEDSMPTLSHLESFNLVF